MKQLIEHWWAACARGELLFRACPQCQSVTYLPRLHCFKCSCEMQWRLSSGRGTAFAVTRVHKSAVTAAGSPAPYTIGYVRLDEGFLMLSTLPASATIGDRLKVTFVRLRERTVPVCTPSED